MKERAEHAREPLARIFAVTGCLAFSVLALKVGATAVRARETHTLMPNWKNGGTITYETGFVITGVLCLFAIMWGYCAIYPQKLTAPWNRDRQSDENTPNA